MKNLFDAARVEEVKQRIGQLRADSQRQWGKMNAPQMIAHSAGSFEQALGVIRPPRLLLGRIIGPIVKPKVLGNDDPLRRNSQTVEGLVIHNERDLAKERVRLFAMIDRFVVAGPSGCTTHPHSFFGRLTPEEWAILMYKHLDHHLRQFAV
jgi:Protein of unknown function (DUF1569)